MKIDNPILNCYVEGLFERFTAGEAHFTNIYVLGQFTLSPQQANYTTL